MKNLIHRLGVRRRESGFTISELMVAMLAFIVLASIATPILLSQRNSISESELKADLVNAAINIDEEKVNNGGKYPEAIPSNVRLTSDEALLRYTYPYDRTAYCLQIVAGDKSLFKSSESSEVSATDCTYEYIVPSTQLTGKMRGFAPVLSWNTVANATSYVIYKNNIPVKTVTMSAGSTARTASYTLPVMTPMEKASFHVVVADGGNQSSQSNSVTLEAPVPAPKTPVISLKSKTVKNATAMEFVIGWTAVKYAKSYEVFDVSGSTPVKLDSLTASAGSYKIETQRGTMKKLIVRAINTEGSSPDSNILVLSSEWDKAEIVSAKSDAATGKIAFVFHKDVANGGISPDYGWPNSTVKLKVVKVSTGETVFEQAGINAKTYTPSKVFDRVDHVATIIPTTSTGEVLSESPAVTIDFPKPTKPNAVTGFTSTTGGDAVLTPNRLKWTAVTCSPSSTPEYKITHDGFASAWVEGTYYNIPSTWLAEGSVESFSIVARCSNANGISDSSTATTTEFTTGLVAPTTPTNIRDSNNGRTITWNAAICANNSFPEYALAQIMKNGQESSFALSALKPNTYTFTDLVGGFEHDISVAARCVQYNQSGTVKASSSWSAYSGYYSWKTPYEKPAKPTLVLDSKQNVNDTMVSYRVKWAFEYWSQVFDVYDVKTNEIIATVNTNEVVINQKRGTESDIYVIARNKDQASDKSASLKLKDVWAKPVFLETVADPYSGFINLKWQNDVGGVLTPDWGGNSATYLVRFTDTETDEVKTYGDLTTGSLTGDYEFLGRNPQVVELIVRTSTGVSLNATPVTVTFPPPGKPAKVSSVGVNSTGPGVVKPNRIYWNSVSCGKATTEYLITDSDGVTSEWIEADVYSATQRSFNIPEEWLMQGFSETFTVQARCVNPAGASEASDPVSLTFVVTINNPYAVEGLKNDGVSMVSWTHADAPSGLAREYQVSTKTFNGVTSTATYKTTNSSFLVDNLLPDKNQVVTVQTRFYNPTTNLSSGWSTAVSTSWKTPKPVPGTPEATLDSSTVLNATTQRYTISWAATTWAEGYRVINDETGAILATVTTTTANIDLKRGIDETIVYVEAYNTSAASPKSNDLSLYAPWEEPIITSIAPNRDGTVNFVWQSGTAAVPSPDWGAPSSLIGLEVRTGSPTGAVVYNVANLKTVDHTTTAFANTQTLRNSTYYAKIQVQTSTGVIMDSSWEIVKFERPITPARVTNVRSDAQGGGFVKNDRLLWDATVCSQPNTEAQYWVASVPPGTNYSTSGTDKVNFLNWTANVTSAVIPQSHIVDIQGENLGFIVLARCVFTDSKDSSSYSDPIVDGDGYHEFTVGLAAPTVNPGVPTRASTFNNTVNWSAAKCGVGTYPEYRLNQTVKNGVSGTTLTSLDELTLALPGITAGANQSLQVQARCIKISDDTKASSYGPYSSVYSYRAPLPKPAAPAIKSSAIIYTTNIAATQAVTWDAVPNAENYVVYDGTTVLSTLPAATRSYTVPMVRGNTAAAKNITVKATNFMYAVAAVTASNKLTLSAPWDDVALDTVTSNQTRQFIATWQTGAGKTRTPNWGDDSSKVVFVIRNAANTADVYRSASLTTNGITTPAMPGTDAKFIGIIEVTTANNEKIISDPITIALNPPAKPVIPTNFKFADGTAALKPGILTWTAVTCTTTGSTPQYYITHTDAEFGNKTTGWTVTGATYTIPQSWLEAGRAQTFAIEARCTSSSGDSPSSGKVTITSPVIKIPVPAKVNNLTVDSNLEDGTASLSWDAVVCPAHLDAGYSLKYVTRNGVANTSMVQTYTDTVVSLTGLTQGKLQAATVIARCYDPANQASNTSLWADSIPSNTVSWTTPIPVPAKQTLTVSGVKTNATNEGKTDGTLTWNVPTWTENTRLYNSSGTLVGTYAAGTTSVVQSITRGTSVTYYVVPVNAQGAAGAKSATVTIASTWPSLKLTQSSYNDVTGDWGGKWATAAQNPDWGTTATFQFVIKNSALTAIFNDTSLPYTTIASTKRLPNAANTYSMYVVVTTASGSKITSNTITVDHVTTPSAPTGLTTNSHTGIKWNAVSCPSGSTANYWILWSKKNGATASSTYATTSTSYTLPGMTANSAQSVQVRAQCRSTEYGDSAWSGYTGVYNFTSYYAIPTTVAKPTGVNLNSAGSTNTSELDRLSWTHVTCPTGSTRSYTVRWNHKHGKKYDESPHNRSTPFYTLSNVTANYYNLTAAQQQQGSRTSWTVEATCAVTLGEKSSGEVATGWQTASIDDPKGSIGGSNNGYFTFTWNALTCPAGTKEYNRLRVSTKNGVDIENYWTDYFIDADNSRSLATDVDGAKYGAKQTIYVSANCQFENHDGNIAYSINVHGTSMSWVPKVSKPTITNYSGSKSAKKASFTVECPVGTTFKYVWTVQNSAGTYVETAISSYKSVSGSSSGNPTATYQTWSAANVVEYNMDAHCAGINADSDELFSAYYKVS